jgi:hypothetical protein
MNSANTGAGAQYAYQQASIPHTTVLPQYSFLNRTAPAGLLPLVFVLFVGTMAA